MSLLDKASLIVTPNAYKESKLYSVIPTSGAGDMNVVRATTATRKNSAGFIEVMPKNLAQYSEQFDNAYWVKNAVTITPNAIAAPNGIVTADKLVENSSNTLHYLNLPASSTPSGTNTISVYAKADGRDWLWLYFFDGVLGSLTAYFNISNGTLGTVQSGLTANILSIGNGWYRCSITRTQANAGNGGFGLGTADNVQSYLGNGTSGAYIWAAQLEIGTTATDYFPTTTRLNIPRIDYTNGTCPSLFVEPQRTNSLTYSSIFSNAAWAKQNTSITDNSIISPDGNLNARKFIANSVNAFHAIYNGIGVYSGTYTFSIYAKKGEYNFLILQDQFSSVFYNVFNLNTGTVASGSNSSIVSVGNGWYRCIVTFTATATTVFPTITISPNTGASYLGNSSNGGYLYGAQMEIGAYPTSLIPTVASSVTRNMDIISKTGISSLIGQTEGTLYGEIKLETANGGSAYCAITSGSFTNFILFGKEAGVTPNKLAFGIRANGTNIIFDTSISLTSSFVKCAIAYKSGSWAVYLNGSLVFSGTNTFTFSSALNSFGFTTTGDFTSMNEKIEVKSTQIYKTRLTNTELAQLTTI